MTIPFTGPYSLNPSQTFDWFNSGVTSGIVALPMGFEVGSDLYYVTAAYEGSHAGGQNTARIWIQKSTDAGKTWTQKANGPNGLFGFACVLVGTKIYLFGINDDAINNNMWVFRYDTATDTFLDTGTDTGRLMSGPNITAAAFNDGKILVAYTDSALGAENAFALYAPLTNTLGAAVNADNLAIGGSNLWQVHDPTSDLMMVGYFTNGTDLIPLGAPVGSGLGSYAVVVSEALTVQNGVLCQLFPTLSGNQQVWDIQGNAVVKGTQVFVGYRFHDPGDVTKNNFAVTFSTIGTTLSFNWASPENLQAYTGSPTTMWMFENEQPAAWLLGIDNTGNLYAFYSLNVSFNDNSGSVTSLAYQQRTGVNTWSAPTTFFTGPTPSSSLALCPITLTNGIGLFEAYVNPVLYLNVSNPNNQYNSLTVIYFGAPTGAGGPCGGNLPQPSTDVQFELKRVYATMTPHKRIPVRGS